jgi:AsmA protein
MRFILAVIALIALLAGLIVVAPGLVPVGAYKGRVEAAASNALGRAVTIGDGLRFKLVPQTSFHVADLEIANAEGFDAPFLAQVKAADIGVKLMPLLRGEVEITQFVLTEPAINLARSRDGGVNWNLAGGAPAEGETGQQPRDIRLGDVRIIDGAARFEDAAAAKTYAFADIDATARLKRLDEPLEVDGTATFQGAPVEIKLVLSSLAKMLAKEPANLKLDLRLGNAQASADLLVATASELSYSGPVALDAPDLPAFSRLMGAAIADGPGFDKLKVEGEAAGGPNALRLAGAKIAFDAIDATGDIGVVWGGARPKANGRLAVGALDLRPYLPPPATAAQGFPAWSEEKIDFASLRNIDADFDLTADKIFLNDLKFGESRMKLKIEDGRMIADIPELGMYGGGGSGQLVVNARQATPSLSGKFDVGSVEAQPFTTDLMKTDRLLGLGGFKLDFSASGSSQAAIMRSMDGSGGFEVADGALKGVNLAKLARAVDEIRKGGLNPTALASAIATAQKPDEKTDFNEFLSNFSIVDGAVSAPTISLKGPFIAMTGTGDVDLPGQTLDLRLAPRATTTIDGEGGQALAVPVRVVGTFSQPKITIDAEALLKGRLEGGLKDFLSKALRKDQPPAQGGGQTGEPPAEEPNPARQILDGILKPPPAENPDAGAGGGDPAATPSATPIEETILNEGLNRLFKKKPPEPEPAETADAPAEPQ